MKVFIGHYNSWFQPAVWYKSWAMKRASVNDMEAYDAREDRLRANWLYKILQRIERWVDSRYERKVDIRIDRYDVWNMDATLSLIILPMLKLLKETKQGYAHVDDEDVPEELRSTSPSKITEEQKAACWPDDNGLLRWNWVLDEIIWAFAQEVDEDSDDQFFGAADLLHGRRNFDREGYHAWSERKANAFKLFGKYFEALWD